MNNNIHSPLRIAALMCVASLAAALPTQASDMKPHSTMATEVKHADKAFFEKAAKSGMEEVAISTGALDRLTNPQVKDFAQMMVTDHTAVNAELATLASAKGVVLPVKDKEVMNLSDKWSKKTKGVEDDYLAKMIDDHQEAVKLFEKESKSTDMELAAFAQKTLPSLQHHLDMAKSLKTMVK